MKIADLATALDLATRYQRLDAAIAGLGEEVARKTGATYPVQLTSGAVLYLTASDLWPFAQARLLEMGERLRELGVDPE